MALYFGGGQLREGEPPWQMHERPRGWSARAFDVSSKRYLTSTSSTSNSNVALGGMAPPAPRAP